MANDEWGLELDQITGRVDATDRDGFIGEVTDAFYTAVRELLKPTYALLDQMNVVPTSVVKAEIEKALR